MDFNLIGLVLFYIVVFCIFSVCFLVCVWIFEKFIKVIKTANELLIYRGIDFANGKDYTVTDVIPQREADKISKAYKDITDKLEAKELKMPRYWYKFQVYNPRDPWSDGLGYVHLKSKKSYDFYCLRLASIKNDIANLRKNYKKIVKLDGRTAYIDNLRYLNDKLENIPHSYGRKEYTGERKK